MIKAASQASQRGAVLFVTLIVLVAVTLLVVMMSALSRSNLQIVRNNQSEQQRIALAQRAVETVMGDITHFTSPTTTIEVENTDGMQVLVSNRLCVRAVAAMGYSVGYGAMPPIDTVWNFTVTVSDPMTGGSTVMTQGARIRMMPDACV